MTLREAWLWAEYILEQNQNKEQLSTGKSMSPAIYEMAKKISDWCQSQVDENGKGRFHYDKDSSSSRNAARPSTYLSEYGWNYEPVGPEWTMCCGSYVWWVLAELGITKSGQVGFYNYVKFMTDDDIQKYLLSDYEAYSIGRDIRQAQQGDILVFGNGTSHTSIYHGYTGSKIVEYGMGNTPWMDGSTKGPHEGRSKNALKHIIRIFEK